MAWGESYFPDPDTVDHADCGVCGSRMSVTRGCDGPTNFAMAMSKSTRVHDSFTCPHREEDWHIQVRRLKSDARHTASTRLQNLYEEEIKEILETRTATKKVYY